MFNLEAEARPGLVGLGLCLVGLGLSLVDLGLGLVGLGLGLVKYGFEASQGQKASCLGIKKADFRKEIIAIFEIETVFLEF